MFYPGYDDESDFGGAEWTIHGEDSEGFENFFANEEFHDEL